MGRKRTKMKMKIDPSSHLSLENIGVRRYTAQVESLLPEIETTLN